MIQVHYLFVQFSHSIILVFCAVVSPMILLKLLSAKSQGAASPDLQAAGRGKNKSREPRTSRQHVHWAVFWGDIIINHRFIVYCLMYLFFIHMILCMYVYIHTYEIRAVDSLY